MDWPSIQQHVLRRFQLPAVVRHVEFLGAAGGFSGAQFWRMSIHETTWCLRAWAPNHPSPERLAWIHAVLRHVAGRGCNVIPVPLATESGPSFVSWQDRLWELAPWMPGAADYDQDPLLCKLQGAMRLLADFHLAASSFPGCAMSVGPPSGLPSRLEFMNQLDGGMLAQLWLAVRQGNVPFYAETSSILKAYEQFRGDVSHLLSQAAALPVRNHVCLRDVWHDHILFQQGQVSGLVDFGAMNVDCAAADISRLLGSLVADDETGWCQGVAAYEAIRPLTENERTAIRAYDTSSVLLSGINWLKWLLLESRQFDSPDRVRGRLQAIKKRLTTLAAKAQNSGEPL
jgi:Ser/Thr protein kinase RdoA (MazF antagonist)